MRSVSKEANVEDVHGQVSGYSSRIIEGERCLATDKEADEKNTLAGVGKDKPGVYLRACDEASNDQLWFTEHGKLKSATTGLCVDVDVRVKGKGVSSGSV